MILDYARTFILLIVFVSGSLSRYAVYICVIFSQCFCSSFCLINIGAQLWPPVLGGSLTWSMTSDQSHQCITLNGYDSGHDHP
jgi:hypothetical protein